MLIAQFTLKSCLCTSGTADGGNNTSIIHYVVSELYVMIGIYLVVDSVLNIKNIPLPQYTIMAWCSVKAQGQLIRLNVSVNCLS